VTRGLLFSLSSEHETAETVFRIILCLGLSRLSKFRPTGKILCYRFINYANMYDILEILEMVRSSDLLGYLSPNMSVLQQRLPWRGLGNWSKASAIFETINEPSNWTRDYVFVHET
jgi:hypothetical protein